MLRQVPRCAAQLVCQPQDQPQAAVGAQVQRVVEESERGLCLMADAMDAYLSLPAALKAEEACHKVAETQRAAARRRVWRAVKLVACTASAALQE